MLFIQLASDQNSLPVSVMGILYDTLLCKDPPLIQRLMCCIAAPKDLHARTNDLDLVDIETCGSLKLRID
jgi:hypothetical protein